jgi:endonuclease/exonuclease/phosphatase family metal-dependent hydrolase
MYIVSVNVRFGGSNVAARARRIARSVKDLVPNFESVLFFVQECSAPALIAIRREIGDTHVAFARPNYRTHIGPFVATFVPLRCSVAAVSWHRTPHTTMWRDYHTILLALGPKKEKENETKEEKEEEKEKEKGLVEVYNVHLDSCKENVRRRKAQVASIARESSGPFAILGDLNDRVKLVCHGIDARTVATWRVRGTDHKARLYRLTLLE